MLATVSADAGSWGRAGGGRGWSGRGGSSAIRSTGGVSRSVQYPRGAVPRTYYRSSYPSSYTLSTVPAPTVYYQSSYPTSYWPSYYVSSYPSYPQTVATPVMEVAPVAPAQAWYPPPPPASLPAEPPYPTGQEQYQSAAADEDVSGTLVIAIGTNYSDRTDIPHLRYAASDTQKVYDTLSARQSGPVTGVLLVGEDATRSNILSAIDKANSWQGPVVFYFSGHGSPDLTGRDKLGFLVTSDTDTSYPGRLQQTAISLSEIWADLQNSPARSVFAAVDICFTGTGKSILTDGAKPLIVSRGAPERAFDAESGPVEIGGPAGSRVLLLSSSANQPSWEDGKKLKGGIFTHYLLAGLQGGVEKNGVVKVQELVRYVKREVKAAARKLKGVDQTPQAVGDGEFVVASAKRQVPVEQRASTRESYARY